ncbi:MAG: hypothetical protein U5N26_10985 [Candidatus Marinimicrobia bacterium]|nr:hypothetical protein [Candidatus Neomarinimicrobiota bacterium]
MKSFIAIFPLLAIFILTGCSGEGYIRVKNETGGEIMVSVNHAADEVLEAGETTDPYSVTLTRGVVNRIPVSASGEWLGEYTESVSLSTGETRCSQGAAAAGRYQPCQYLCRLGVL